MDNATRDFFLETRAQALVFGKADSFLLLPLGCDAQADPEVLVDGVSRGWKLCGYCGTCRGCGGIAAIAVANVPDAAFTMVLARERYAGWLSDLDDQVSALHKLHELQDPRQ